VVRKIVQKLQKYYDAAINTVTISLVRMFFFPRLCRRERQHLGQHLLTDQATDQAVQQMRPHFPWIVHNIQVAVQWAVGSL